MTYAEAVAHLYALGPELPPVRHAGRAGASGSIAPPTATPPRKFDLAHMRTICAALGNPQHRFPAVLIAGTNGKGSTAATLASILAVAGYRTGLYTSPHLIRVNERIQLARPVLPTEYGVSSVHLADGPLRLAEITDGDYARLYTQVDTVCEQLVSEGALPMPPSFFERLTAVAFLYFAGEAPAAAADIVVLEVGLGGRLDATNVVEPMLSVITDIALDHQEYLGETIAEITREKCGILRRNGTLVTLPQLPEANQTIGVLATELGVRAINAAQYVPSPRRADSRVGLEPAPFSPGYAVQIDDPLEPGELIVDSPLQGTHQQRNVALAIAAAVCLRNKTGAESSQISNQSGYEIPNAAIAAGIRITQWPGRLERLPPNLLLDVAHNPAGAWTLRSFLAGLPADSPRTLIFSCLRDKNLAEMTRILFPLFDSAGGSDPQRCDDHIVLAPIPNRRASSLEDLVQAADDLGVQAEHAPDLAAALALARRVTPAEGLIVATGSVYLVGELRRLALGLPDPLAGVLA